MSRYLFVVRHGERADFGKLLGAAFNKEVENKSDPKLTEKGHDQARATAKLIRSGLDAVEAKTGKKFTSITIECSPFIRCISTATSMAKELSIDSVKTNYLFVEGQTTFFFKFNPMPHLYVKNKTP